MILVSFLRCKEKLFTAWVRRSGRVYDGPVGWSVGRLCQSSVPEWCARAMFFGRVWASGKVSGKVLWRDFGVSGKVSGRGSGKVCGTLGHANLYLLLLFG